MTDSDEESTYTIDVNGNRYELNDELRATIQERAAREFSRNEYFSCWWKLANEADYSDEEWEENNHENGDPVLVIETRGEMVPWEDLDQLKFEMQEIEQDSEADDDPDEIDEGNGMKTLDPDDAVDEHEGADDIGRTHFPLTPQSFEEVPSPEEDDPSKIPPKPVAVDGTELVWWLPKHPEIEECWSAGEAITPTTTWTEWNVQAKADDVRPKPDDDDKPNSHDMWESMARSHDCEKVGEYQPSQQPPRESEDASGQVERKGEDQFEDGKFGGNNFHV